MNEITIFENDNWKVTKYKGKNSGWIIGDRWAGNAYIPVGDNWIYYGDSKFGFDHPELIPEYIKDKVRAIFRPKKGYNRDDVEFHSNAMFYPVHPAINVKAHSAPDFWKLKYALEDAGYNLSDKQIESAGNIAFSKLQREFWNEFVPKTIESIYGKWVKWGSEGRQSGWLAVYNLPEVESWDVVDLAKWHSLESKLQNWIKQVNTVENYLILLESRLESLE